MNYTIFSIDDSRKRYTKAIRKQLASSFWWDEIEVNCVDGRVPSALDSMKKTHKYEINASGLKIGQLGVWYTVLNALELSDTLVTFEDDTLLHPAFNDLFWKVTSKLPKDTDAFALFLPRDQDHVYYVMKDQLDVAPGICRAYQRYGGVSMMWTPQGADKLRALLREDGITGQWDDQAFEYAKERKLNIYTQVPDSPILVGVNPTEPSLVQNTEYV